MKKTIDTLITALIIAAIIFVPYLFGSVLYDDDMAAMLWIKGVLTILGLISGTYLIISLVMLIYTTVKNWKV